MPRITCLHGHEIELLATQLGQRIACPTCQLLMTVSPPRPGEPLVPKYEVLCENGHVLRVKSKYMGTQIRCPQCQALALVTTDRLLKHTTTATPEPIVPALFAPVPRQVIPATMLTPVVNAQVLANIPIAEVDEDYSKPRKPPLGSNDDGEEEDREELTKAERRNLKLVDQGLGYYLGSVIGYCSIQMMAMVISFLLFLMLQAVSTANGFQTLGTISKVVGWCIFFVMVLNALLYLGGIVLTLFMPWVTGVTVWFVLTLVLSLVLIGWILFVSIYYHIWNTTDLPRIFSKEILYLFDKPFYFVGEAIFLFMWLTMTIALWQIGKYARKPLTRQRVMLLGMLGSACWAVIVFAPLLSHIDSDSKAVGWIILIFRVILTLGIGGLMIFQHLNVVNEVRSVMYRRR
ncbi:MAG TPA: hypothetical protein PLN21_07275 [Gemmatales bacterium]|nr:hypothetical protein [Gemmatales bacterium]